jgi:hypothetical protein
LPQAEERYIFLTQVNESHVMTGDITPFIIYKNIGKADNCKGLSQHLCSFFKIVWMMDEHG